LSLLQGRFDNLSGLSSEFLRTLSPDVRRRVKGLKSLQRKHTALEAEYQKEILSLEKKYLTLYTPLYQKRADFISGKVEPTDAEVEEGKSDDEGEEEEKEEDDDDDKDAQNVEGNTSRKWEKTRPVVSLNSDLWVWADECSLTLLNFTD